MSDILDGGGVIPPDSQVLDGGSVAPAPETSPLPEEDTFGVTVSDVRELAAHIGRTGVAGDDPDFGSQRVRITDAQVARWIAYVADSVRSRIITLSRYSTNTGRWAGVVGSARTAVVNGAAAYLVSAAYPARAGTNDQANYSAELTARYEREMTFLMELPEVFREEDEAHPAPLEPGTDLGIRASYNPARIPNDSPLFFHTRPALGSVDPNVYRRPTAPGAEEAKGYRANPHRSW